MAKVATKPAQFQEFQKAAKGILEAKEMNYYKWLHAMHMKVVHEVISENPEELAVLVGRSNKVVEKKKEKPENGAEIVGSSN